jgi:hypothetical protein
LGGEYPASQLAVTTHLPAAQQAEDVLFFNLQGCAPYFSQFQRCFREARRVKNLSPREISGGSEFPNALKTSRVPAWRTEDRDPLTGFITKRWFFPQPSKHFRSKVRGHV